ncbi:hypothetical protein BDB00DRAFT_926331, partial [Zychaea mexicana]|uniref:uncharacterized protein n=1 Tax=Zychaea mexicana TaxID=64656 RepID=UPI0022FE4F47
TLSSLHFSLPFTPLDPPGLSLGSSLGSGLPLALALPLVLVLPLSVLVSAFFPWSPGCLQPVLLGLSSLAFNGVGHNRSSGEIRGRRNPFGFSP